VPSISSSTRSNLPTSISPGNGFGQYTLHY
jgi:hypothetical protein